MKKVLRTFIFIALSSAVIYCWVQCDSGHNKYEGIVFKKEYRPAGKGLKREEQIVSRPRKNRVTNIRKVSLHQVEYPNRWVVFVHSKDLKDTNCFFVYQSVYDTLQTGSWFVFDQTMGTVDEPYKLLKK